MPACVSLELDRLARLTLHEDREKAFTQVPVILTHQLLHLLRVDVVLLVSEFIHRAVVNILPFRVCARVDTPTVLLILFLDHSDCAVALSTTLFYKALAVFRQLIVMGRWGISRA